MLPLYILNILRVTCCVRHRLVMCEVLQHELNVLTI